jgi:hypothetical protein
MEKPPMKRAAVLTLALLSAPALAQDEVTTGQQIIYQDVTEHIFDGVNVDGDIIVPELVLNQERKPMKIGSFIVLRTDFDQEMSSSVSEVR